MLRNQSISLNAFIAEIDPAGAQFVSALPPQLLGVLSNINVTCSKMVEPEDSLKYVATKAKLDRAIYCGYKEARCDGASAISREVCQALTPRSERQMLSIRLLQQEVERQMLSINLHRCAVLYGRVSACALQSRN